MANTTEEAELANRVANFIKEKRLARGETQEQLSLRAFGSTDRSRVNKIEKGRPIALFTLHKILTALNCDIDFIEN